MKELCCKGKEHNINKHSSLITSQFSEKGRHTVIQIIIYGQCFDKSMSKILEDVMSCHVMAGVSRDEVIC